MLFTGPSNTRVFKDYNKELQQNSSYFNDEEVRESLCKFLRQNIAFTVELMTGKPIFAYQELIIRCMFVKDFFLLLAGRGAAKSWTSSQFAWLYAIMTPGVRIGILSRS